MGDIESGVKESFIPCAEYCNPNQPLKTLKGVLIFLVIWILFSIWGKGFFFYRLSFTEDDEFTLIGILTSPFLLIPDDFFYLLGLIWIFVVVISASFLYCSWVYIGGKIDYHRRKTMAKKQKKKRTIDKFENYKTDEYESD